MTARSRAPEARASGLGRMMVLPVIGSTGLDAMLVWYL